MFYRIWAALQKLKPMTKSSLYKLHSQTSDIYCRIQNLKQFRLLHDATQRREVKNEQIILS